MLDTVTICYLYCIAMGVHTALATKYRYEKHLLSLRFVLLCSSLCSQVVCLREVFPYSAGIVLAFDYMPTDLASVLRNSERRLSEVCAGWAVGRVNWWVCVV